MKTTYTHKGAVEVECCIAYVKQPDVIVVHVGTNVKRPEVVGCGATLLIVGVQGRPDSVAEYSHIQFELPNGFEFVASSTGRDSFEAVFVKDPLGMLDKAMEDLT